MTGNRPTNDGTLHLHPKQDDGQPNGQHIPLPAHIDPLKVTEYLERKGRERDGEEGKKEKREIKEGAHHHLSERNSRPPAERESCWVDSKVRPNSLTTALRLPAN